ncbi:translation initiation factor IF-2-like isoform X2 [Vidua chalybeata]|uniref:translation initiation factor IF-2-like isoform X2 n=1 Tax=Vidua chalybeata TaxID=81927 RepID=UPI0023A84CC1|nr:translation initiation factor IF-2-like isoform X2 [Vidua chalybeata]
MWLVRPKTRVVKSILKLLPLPEPGTAVLQRTRSGGAAAGADAVVQRQSPWHVCTRTLCNARVQRSVRAGKEAQTPRQHPAPSAPRRAGAAGAAGPAAPRAGAGAEPPAGRAAAPPAVPPPLAWKRAGGSGSSSSASPALPLPGSPARARSTSLSPAGGRRTSAPRPPLEQPGFLRLCFLGRRWERAGSCSCWGCGASPCSRGVSARQITDADVKKGQSRGEASVDASVCTDGLRRWRLPAWCWRGGKHRFTELNWIS